MKTFPLLLIAAVVMLYAQAGYAQRAAGTGNEGNGGAGGGAPASTQIDADAAVKAAMNQAQKDYVAGDIAGAKERFEYVLQLDPRNMAAQNYLHIIATKEKEEGKNGGLEKALTGLVIPKVELKEATFDTALEYLKQMAEKADGGKTKVNFVVELTPDVIARTKVSLSLSDVPFTVVLHYVSEKTGFVFKIEKYAITVKQPSAAAPEASGTDAAAVAPDANVAGMK